MTAIVLVADDWSVTDVEQATVAELYAAYRLRLVRLATLLVDDQDSAEDVVQDVFARLPHGWQPAEAGKALPYLQRAVVNASRSVLRRRRTARLYVVPHEPDRAGPDTEVILAEEHREVLAALNQLPTRQREVLVLRYWSDLSEAEIASTLGISRGTVKSTASRAIDALERALGGAS
jgi:RNA polymerase sigma-70 factor (sigma-E family)